MKSIGIIYGGKNGMVGAINRYYGCSGIVKVRNGVRVVRINTDLTEVGYRQLKTEIEGIDTYYRVSGEIWKLPKRVQESIEERGYCGYGFTEELKELRQRTYGRKGKREREIYREGMFAGMVEVLTRGESVE